MADFRVSPGVPREKSKKIYDVRQKFRVFLAIFHEKTRFFGFFGVPVIKEEKAIALRPYDIFVLFHQCAMQWTQISIRDSQENGCILPKNGGQKQGILGCQKRGF